MNSVSIQSSPGLTLSETRCSKPPSTVRGSSVMTRSAQASAARFSAGSRVRAVQQRQGQHRRGGVDVEGRQRLRQLLGVPALEQRQLVGPARRLPGAEQPVEPDPLRPFPAVEADVVARRPVEVRLVEAALVAQAGEPGDQPVQHLRDLGAV